MRPILIVNKLKGINSLKVKGYQSCNTDSNAGLLKYAI